MTRSDRILHDFSIYQIKRHTIKPYDFKWTSFYENSSDFFHRYSSILLDIAEDELVICSTVINADNYSVLTTRQLITKENGIDVTVFMIGATRQNYPIILSLKNIAMLLVP